MGLAVGMKLSCLDPRKAFQANVCFLGFLFGSSFRARFLKNADPEFASNIRACVLEVVGAGAD